MARYEQAYSGERRTSALHVQMTPGERAEFETAACQAGVMSLSAYARLLLFHRLAEFEMLASPRRNPDARKLIYELCAIGNNLNQLAKIANTTKALTVAAELAEATALLRAAIARVIAL
jgi:Bacterial mobilisation protein (MobC)